VLIWYPEKKKREKVARVLYEIFIGIHEDFSRKQARNIGGNEAINIEEINSKTRKSAFVMETINGIGKHCSLS
jgi:hypothetical protein